MTFKYPNRLISCTNNRMRKFFNTRRVGEKFSRNVSRTWEKKQKILRQLFIFLFLICFHDSFIIIITNT